MHETAPLPRTHRTICPHCEKQITARFQSAASSREAKPARKVFRTGLSISDFLPSGNSRQIGNATNRDWSLCLIALAALLILPGCASLPNPSALEGTVAPDGAYHLRVEFDAAGRQLPLCKEGYAK